MCDLCNTEPATVKTSHMYLCPACKALVQDEADRRLALIVAAMTEIHERETA